MAAVYSVLVADLMRDKDAVGDLLGGVFDWALPPPYR